MYLGQHVKERIVPSGLTVTGAAKRLGVGRPALSNFLNGKARYRPRWAAVSNGRSARTPNYFLSFRPNSILRGNPYEPAGTWVLAIHAIKVKQIEIRVINN